MYSGTRISVLRRTRTIAVACGMLGLSILLGACGSNGSQGPAGAAGAAGATGPTGPTGPAGPGPTVAIGSAQTLTATITAVTFPAAAPVKPVVKFNLVNESGSPVTGLQASAVGFAVAKLVPAGTQLAAVPPLTAAPALQNSTQWQSYIYHTAKPASALAAPYTVSGKVALPQATTEAGTSGTLVDNGDGTYQYTFAKDVSTDPAVSYSAALTHRVGFEIRGAAPANSPTFTLQPSTGATTGIASREIVDDQTCETCHHGLAAHGGARTEVQYCVMCHNPSTFDPSTSQSLDMKVMFHKLHMGQNLPDVAAGGKYYIVGYMNSISDYSTLNFPTGDLRTCNTCHNESDPKTPDTVGWRQNPGIEACSSCHDTDNFASGANHSPIMLGGLTNANCASCHGNATTAAKESGLIYKTISGAGGTLGVKDVHVIPERDFQQKFQYQVLSVTKTAPGEFPAVKFKVVDPTNSNKAWNVTSDEPFTHCNPATENSLANLSVAISYSSTDYTNIGSGNTSEVAEPIAIPVTCGSFATPVAAAPVANGDGSFTVTSTTAIPAAATGSAGVMLQGHPAHEFGDTAYFYNTGEAGTSNQEIPIPQSKAMTYWAITGTTPVARRTVVASATCDSCHDQLNGHGNNRVGDPQMCSTCHNPNATDVKARASAKPAITWAAPDATDGRGEQTIDLKVMIHAIHAAPDIAGYAAAAGFTYTPYVVYHRGNKSDWMTSTAFPTFAGSAGDSSAAPSINDCTACHTGTTYYPPDPASSPALATTTDTSSPAAAANAGGVVATTAGAAVCSACHITSDAKDHMVQNGASFTAAKSPTTGQLIDPVKGTPIASQETCVICHSAGGIADVTVVHKLSTFQ